MGTSGESLNSGRQILMFFFYNQMVFLEHAAKVMLAGKIWWFSSRFFWKIIKTDGFRSDFLMCSLDFPWISIKKSGGVPEFSRSFPMFFSAAKGHMSSLLPWCFSRCLASMGRHGPSLPGDDATSLGPIPSFPWNQIPPQFKVLDAVQLDLIS